MRHFKFKRGGVLAAAALLLAGCASAPQKAPTGGQPLATLNLPVPAGEDAAARVLAAEFALQHGDAKSAAADYAMAAGQSDDPAVAQRAVELNLAIQDEPRASAALARWQALGASPRELVGARAQLAMLRGDRATAAREFDVLLASGKVDDWKAFGRALLQARDAALAGGLLEQLAPPSRLPADQGLWIGFSQLGEKLGRHAYAQRLADAAVKRFGGAPSLAWAAQMKLAAGDRAAAKALFVRALAAHPDDTDLRMAYAALLGQDGDNAGAGRVLAAGPQDAETWAARVAYAARANDKVQLANLYSQLERAPEDVREDSAFLLGQLAELLDKDGEALKWYAQVGDDDDHAFDAQARSAVLLDKAGRHDEAHSVARALQQDYADDPDSLRRAFELDAELYMRADDAQAAVAAYTRGLHAIPNDGEMLYGRGLSEAEAGDTAAAIADLRRVLGLKPDDVEAMNALGYTLADSNQDLAEAAQLLGKALQAKPQEPAIIDSWGWLQYRLGHPDVAEQALQRAWGLSKDADIGVHLGEVLWKLGKQEQAQAVFAQVRKIDPSNRQLRATLQRLQP
ncbi:MAG TPA: tetratricopeptide repeat protein [Rhodanobacteraceae bacterium]|nr:tetratricopeptide repeat protein [Rhodanobacteraceae bacterium]